MHIYHGQSVGLELTENFLVAGPVSRTVKCGHDAENDTTYHPYSLRADTLIPQDQVKCIVSPRTPSHHR